MRQCRRLLRRSSAPGKAFTLIEVLVSVGILSVGIVVVLQAFSAAAGILDSTRTITRSSLLLRSKLSEIILDAEHGEIQTGYRSGNFGEPFGDYRWSARVEEVSEVSRDEVRLRFYDVEAEAIKAGAGRRFRLATRVSRTEHVE